MKKNNTLKELATFVCQALLVGVCFYLVALLVFKHNEIHDILFSPTSGLIVTIISVAIVLVIAGFSACFFIKYYPAAAELESLKNEQQAAEAAKKKKSSKNTVVNATLSSETATQSSKADQGSSIISEIVDFDIGDEDNNEDDGDEIPNIDED